MTYIKRDITNENLIQVIRGWIDILAQRRFGEFYDALGYSMRGDTASADWIESDLRRYRSDLYPGVSDFEVTSWETAQNGFAKRKEDVVWYEPNESELAGAVTYHLPLNGKWSDCSADFVLFETDAPEGFLLRLEEINIPIPDDRQPVQ